jgi:ketosteroid isomerase-like protein
MPTDSARVLGAEGDFTRDSPLLAEAYSFARRIHQGQYEESDGQPYINHPVTVGRLLYEAGYDDEVVAAGLLHDTLEHSELTSDPIRERFGGRVASLVDAMTEPVDIEPWGARKAALRRQIADAGLDAEAIFAADKIAKSASLRHALAQLGLREVGRRVSSPLDEKIDHYQASLDLLEAMAADLPFLPRLHYELDAIEEQRIHDDEFELARRAVDAVNRRDAAALAEICDREVEWWPALTLGDRGDPYRGHDGVRRYFVDLESAWSELNIEINDLRSIADRLLALCSFHGRGRRSGIELEQDGVVIYRVSDGKVTGARTLLAPSPALE